MNRFRRALDSRDSGAVAIIVAISSVALFGMAALAIDIGQVYVRRAAAQLDADLAALAGAQGLPNPVLARQLAYNYVTENFPVEGGSAGPLANYADGDPDNGEITITNDNTRIRVVPPLTTVSFGMAGALGFSSTRTNAAATAEIRSPAKLNPYMVATGLDTGYLCLKDDDPGNGGNPAAMRAALFAPKPTIDSLTPPSGPTTGSTTVRIRGNHLDNEPLSVTFDGSPAPYTIINNRTIDVVTPAHAAGGVGVVVTSPDGSSAAQTFLYAEPGPVPAPTITTVDPADGPLAGGNTVTITGTNFVDVLEVKFGTLPATSFTVDSDTQISAVVPPATTPSVVDVTVTTATGTATATGAYTYLTDGCDGANGNFGFLHVPRNDGVTGANPTLKVNIISGIDHDVSTFPAAQLPADVDTPCQSGGTTIPGAILDENCLDVQNGNKISVAADAYLTGHNDPPLDLAAKLADPGSGHDTGTIFGQPNMDVDSLAKYLTVSVADFVNANVAGNTPVEGWVKPEIMQCPRFAIVPVLHTTEHPPNGHYPVVGFRGIFIEGPAPNYGFTPNNNGTQIQSIKAYAFSLGYLPGVVSSSDVDGTVTYIGSGPKIPVLIE